MFTVMFVLYKREGMDQDEALRYWRETHGPLTAKAPGVRSYVQLQATAAPDGEPPFLGVATLEFDDEAAFQTAASSPELATAIKDLENFSVPENLPTAFVEPVTIV
jgi:uncharacterized protein (TIGR02118 family)